MYDPDIIVYLFPPEGQGRDGALEAINMQANRSRFLPPRQRHDLIDPVSETTQSRFAREATEQPEDVDDLKRLPCLVVRFSDRPKTRSGVVVGRSPTSDLMLPKIKGVSNTHFALTFDEQNELVVRDLDSLVGTRVIYDGEVGPRGHRVTWSARGPGLLKGKVPVLKVVGELQFRLVVPNHDVTSPAYLDNVTRFLEGAAAAGDLLSDLKIISRTQTELPTPGEVYTPSAQKPGTVFWQKELGKGHFAVVTYVWDVTSRASYALKEPLRTVRGDWKREAEILKGISHDNIVALKHAVFDNGPQLYFEYVPEGDLSLDRYKVTTPWQRRQVALQLLDVLTYLHDLKIVHRDIKPENVLVQHWRHNRVHVKLGDFGLSKQSDNLETFCGTKSYLAPEVLCAYLDSLANLANRKKRKKAMNYDSLVDIWSLAALLVKSECGGLPEYLDHYDYSRDAWGKLVVEFVQLHANRHGTNDMLSLLLEDMLVVDVEKRQPARKCHEKALRLFGSEKSSDDDDSDTESDPATPKALSSRDVISPSSDSRSWEASTIILCPEEGGDSRQNPASRGSTVLGPSYESLIVDLGERGSDYVDSLLGMKPSATTDFEGAGSPTSDTIQRASMVGNELWETGAIRVESAHGGTDSGSLGSELRWAITHALARAAREDDGCAASRAMGPPSRRKRPRSQSDPGSGVGPSSFNFAGQGPNEEDR